MALCNMRVMYIGKLHRYFSLSLRFPLFAHSINDIIFIVIFHLSFIRFAIIVISIPLEATSRVTENYLSGFMEHQPQRQGTKKSFNFHFLFIVFALYPC